MEGKDFAGEAEPDAGAVGLGGIKGDKDFVKGGRDNTGAVVGDAEDGMLAVVKAGEELDLRMSCIFESFEGIFEEINKGSFEEFTVGVEAKIKRIDIYL